jgi:hypothetical protein
MPSVVTTHAFLIREKALHTANVNQEEDSPLFFLMFLGAMCRAYIQLLLKKARH